MKLQEHDFENKSYRETILWTTRHFIRYNLRWLTTRNKLVNNITRNDFSKYSLKHPQHANSFNLKMFKISPHKSLTG